MSTFNHKKICAGCEFYQVKWDRPVCANKKKLAQYEFESGGNWHSFSHSHTETLYLDGDGYAVSEWRIQDFIGEGDPNQNVRKTTKKVQ